MLRELNLESFTALAGARGWRVGDGATAVLAWARLVDQAGVTETRRAVLVPEVVERFHCPACWTELDPGESPDFLGCPSCGHGMSLVAIENPYRCLQCGRVTDGPPDDPSHVPPGTPDAPSCDGLFERAPYLPFLVAHTDHVFEPVPLAAFAVRGLDATRRVVLSNWYGWILDNGATLHAAPDVELSFPAGSPQ